MQIDLSDNQKKAVEELRNGRILRGDVGSGKSRAAVAYYFSKVNGGNLSAAEGADFEGFTSPRDVYVITTARKRDELDWEAEFAKWGISTERSSSFGEVQLKVVSWNQVAELADNKLSGAFVIFDEQRLVGSGSWVKAFYKIAQHNQWILLSATPGDIWMDYIPVFVANGFYKNRTDFIRTHVVYANFSKFPKVSHYVETQKLQKLKNRLLVEMPDTRHTKRHLHYITVAHDTEAFKRIIKERWNIYEDKPIKDIAELFRVMRKLVNSDPARVEALMTIWQKHPKLIVFYNFNYELDILRKMCEDLWIPWKEWNGQKHEPVPDDDKWIYLVQYTAGAEAWNCITTDAMTFYSLNYSYKIFEQAQGRIDRMNTPFTDLNYYILQSKSAIDIAIKKSLALKKNFNERSLVKTV